MKTPRQAAAAAARAGYILEMKLAGENPTAAAYIWDTSGEGVFNGITKAHRLVAAEEIAATYTAAVLGVEVDDPERENRERWKTTLR